jgi:Na+-driven multidrug efflux pump
MSHILTLLSLVAERAIGTQRGHQWSRELGTAAAAISIAVICAIGAIGCVAAAIWIFSERSLGPGGAALVTAAALLVPGIVVLIAYRSKPAARPVASGFSKELELASLVAAEGKRLMREHKTPVLLAAFLAGLAVTEGRNRS